MNLFDTTLRDGGNVVGHGFNAELTVSIVKGLLAAGIQDIETGNCKGFGAYTLHGATKACSDEEYLDILQPYLPHGRIGMFLMASDGAKAPVEMAAERGLHFLRVGANAGDGAGAVAAIERVKKAGLVCRYSLMKAYVSTPDALAAEAKLLADAGVDKITIMDSAGTMFPRDVTDYVNALKATVSIPVGFHGHSNLGLSQANALAAVAAGADEIDCGLLGMARSAGNCATELAAATLQKEGYLPEVDLYKLLDYLEGELIPAMKPYGYHVAVDPTDLILGLAGCHSSFLPLFQKVAEEEKISARKLIMKVSAINRKNPDETLMRQVAAGMK
ncbi:MAG: 4-hydroxy-2-oxovalerate aldolase [Oscillospiraceae bacterium]|nr:4-hydroxy-2-oxovalerate aldolase [Oscillospiraceae bacterium]